jgi:predicted nucleic acid-binding protein
MGAFAAAEPLTVIVDTDVLIWFLRGRREAADFMKACDRVRLSAVTYMELVQGMRNANELRALRRTLAGGRWQVLPITEAICTRAMTYVEEHFLSGSLQMADALIAATCIEHGEPLATGNLKHYGAIAELSIQPFRIGDS